MAEVAVVGIANPGGVFCDMHGFGKSISKLASVALANPIWGVIEGPSFSRGLDLLFFVDFGNYDKTPPGACVFVSASDS